MIRRNPASKTRLPKLDQKDIRPLSADEQQRLLAALPDNTYGRAIRFIMGTGLRVSELCGLRWCDLEGNGFRVNQVTYCMTRGVVDDSCGEVDTLRGDSALRITCPPKTKAGKRYIPLTLKLRAVLEAQRLCQKQERLRAGSAWVGGEPGIGEQYIFATAVGTPVERHNIGRRLESCMKKAEVEKRGVHALRHTFATNWVQQGGDLRTLSEILGYTKVAFTMQQYVHSDNDVKMKWMEKMEGLV